MRTPKNRFLFVGNYVCADTNYPYYKQLTMINTMKKFFYTLFVTSLLLTSCNFPENVSNQLSFLKKMNNEFGGNWSGSSEGNCYRIEITNSQRLNNNKDSLEHYGTIIGRKFINDIGLDYSCLKLVLKKEKKVAIITSSSSNSFTFDLWLINRFKDRSVKKYLIARKAIYASQSADNDNLQEAEKLLSEIDNDDNNPFIKLAKAHIIRAKGKHKESLRQINELIKSNDSDDILNQYIGIYFIKTNDRKNALSMFKKAASINRNNNEHLINIAAIYYEMEKYDSSAYYCTKVLKVDSLNLKALYNRANSRFKENKNDMGCRDIKRMLEIAPKITLPDSILSKCNLNKR